MSSFANLTMAEKEIVVISVKKKRVKTIKHGSHILFGLYFSEIIFSALKYK